MEEEDITALLGKNLDLNELSKSFANANKEELAKLDPNELESKILNENNYILESAKNALTDVLLQVQTTPNDGELVDGAAKMMNAYGGLLNGLYKVYNLNKKFTQQVKLQAMKILAEDKKNQDNNNTKILLTREQILSSLEKNTNNTVDIESNNESERTEKKI